MTDNENNFYAFLSYSLKDNCEQRSDNPGVSHRCWGKWLHDALKTFAIPAEFTGQINGRSEIIPERIHPVYQDQQERPEESGLNAEIRQALEQSNCLIVVCSPRSAQSLHVNEAVRYFKQLGRGKQILPLVVAGEPNASQGNQPDVSPADECFVPALRHAVRPDGTLDTTRRAARHIFVDVRHGVEQREILANDHRTAEADLEMAKIQLIALLIGVGFNGLWWREQRRHFFELAEAQQQAREAVNQVEAAQRQLQEAQRHAHELQTQSLELQNLPRAVHDQIQAAQDQAHAAQQQASEAQKQLQEFQNKFRDNQTQLEESRHRALAAESQVRETRNHAREIQNQLETTRNQTRAAQNASSQLEEIRHQAQDDHGKFLEAQSQIQEFQRQVQSAQSQLAEAREQVRAAQNQVVEAQNKARAAQDQVQEIQKQTRETQSQLEATRHQAKDDRSKFLEAQNQVQEFQRQVQSAQSQMAEAREQVRAAQSRVVEAQNQARAAQDQVQEMQSRDRDAQSQIEAAQIQKAQSQDWNRRRLNKVFAILAVLALISVGVVAQRVSLQRQAASQALVRAKAESAGTFDLAPAGFEQEPIRLVLQKIGGADQEMNRRRSLDQLAAGIPRDGIPDALAASSEVAEDQQRSHFQKWLLVRLGWANPLAAMNSAAAIAGKIVNDVGQNDSAGYFQLAVLDNWMKTDFSGAFNWACQLPDADSRSRALEKIFRGVQSRPDSESKYQGLGNCISELAKTDVSSALGLAESLPEGAWRSTVIARLRMQADPFAISDWINRLVLPPEIVPPQNASWPWTQYLLNSTVGSPAMVPVETENSPKATNDPIQIQPKE